MPAAGLPPGHHVLEVRLDGGGLARRQVSHHLQTEKTRSLDLVKETLFNFNQLEKLEAARSAYLLLPLVTFPGLDLTGPYFQFAD